MTVERVLAPNPGIFTGPGTNTYLVADGDEVVVVDPGPVIDSHLLAIVDAIGDRTAVAVIATHTHPDHAPLSNPLAARLGVPVLGYGPGPEFEPDVRLGDGDEVRVGADHLVAVHTPGHSSDHLCYQLSERLFTGDHIMEGSTVIIEDAADYLDVVAMQRAAAHFVGEHDFRAFRQASDEREIVVRQMFEVSVTPGWEGRPDVCAFEVVGNAFMKNMVRIMVGTLVDVGRGRIDPDAVPAMLREDSDRADAGQTAPPQGLTLIHIELGRFDGPGDAFDRPTQAEAPRRQNVMPTPP